MKTIVLLFIALTGIPALAQQPGTVTPEKTEGVDVQIGPLCAPWPYDFKYIGTLEQYIYYSNTEVLSPGRYKPPSQQALWIFNRQTLALEAIKEFPLELPENCREATHFFRIVDDKLEYRHEHHINNKITVTGEELDELGNRTDVEHKRRWNEWGIFRSDHIAIELGSYIDSTRLSKIFMKVTKPGTSPTTLYPNLSFLDRVVRIGCINADDSGNVLFECIVLQGTIEDYQAGKEKIHGETYLVLYKPSTDTFQEILLPVNNSDGRLNELQICHAKDGFHVLGNRTLDKKKIFSGMFYAFIESEYPRWTDSFIPFNDKYSTDGNFDFKPTYVATEVLFTGSYITKKWIVSSGFAEQMVTSTDILVIEPTSDKKIENIQVIPTTFTFPFGSPNGLHVASSNCGGEFHFVLLESGDPMRTPKTKGERKKGLYRPTCVLIRNTPEGDIRQPIAELESAGLLIYPSLAVNLDPEEIIVPATQRDTRKSRELQSCLVRIKCDGK